MFRNAGFFIWIDLSPYLQSKALGENKDPWSAAQKLSEMLTVAGVKMSNGTAYHEEVPGRYRIIFTIKKAALLEGLKRFVQPNPVQS